MDDIIDSTRDVIHEWNGWMMEDDRWTTKDVEFLVPIEFKGIWLLFRDDQHYHSRAVRLKFTRELQEHFPNLNAEFIQEDHFAREMLDDSLDKMGYHPEVNIRFLDCKMRGFTDDEAHAIILGRLLEAKMLSLMSLWMKIMRLVLK